MLHHGRKEWEGREREMPRIIYEYKHFRLCKAFDVTVLARHRKTGTWQNTVTVKLQIRLNNRCEKFSKFLFVFPTSDADPDPAVSRPFLLDPEFSSQIRIWEFITFSIPIFTKSVHFCQFVRNLFLIFLLLIHYWKIPNVGNFNHCLIHLYIKFGPSISV
jgi:hypothetical protein